MSRFQALMLAFLIGSFPAAHAYFGVGNFEISPEVPVKDTDGDGIYDWYENLSWWNSTCGLDYTVNDSHLDFDGDGWNNSEEYQLSWNPCLSNYDSDLDGIPDYWEANNGLNKFVEDANLDLDFDELRNLGEYLNGTDVNNNDTDSDTMFDGWEVDFGLEPLNASDASMDKDGDGVINSQEFSGGTDPTKGPFTMPVSPSANESMSMGDDDVSGNASANLTFLTTMGLTGTVNITKYTNISKKMGVNPLTTDFGLTSGHRPIDKGIEVDASDNIRGNLGWVYVKIYYTDAELDNNGDGDAGDPGDINPSTLRMWRYCSASSTWEPLNPKTVVCGNVAVDASGVDTSARFVYANISNLSIFRIAGSLIPEEVGDIITGGGGGGGAPPKTTPPPIFTGGVITLTPQLLIELILSQQLEEKSFWTVPGSVGASMILTGEYPSPFSPMVHGVLAKPVKMLLEPLRVLRGKKVESPEAIKDVYQFSVGRVLTRYQQSDTVIIAVRDPPVDSMAAVAYAKSIDAPILLTETDDAPEDTIDAVEQLNPNKIVIVGGPVAVSDAVESEFKKIAPTERIWGPTRYETAAEISKKLDPSIVVITDGEAPSQDAVIVASEYRAPILYVRGKEIPKPTRDFLVGHTKTKEGDPMSWVTVGIDEDANTEIQGLYSLPGFLTKSRLTVKLYNIGARFFS